MISKAVNRLSFLYAKNGAFIHSNMSCRMTLKLGFAVDDTTLKNNAKKKGRKMEFLKAIYGDKSMTYDELVQAINAHNGDEANKDNQIKIGNLGMGEYVGKGKHENLQALLDASKSDVQTLTETIESLKKGKVDAETLQQKVADAEKLLAESKAREIELKVKYALDVAILAEGVKKENAELLAIALERKLKEKGEVLELDDSDHIKGWDDKISGLKTQYPTMFETSSSGAKKIDENKLPENDENKGLTRSEILKKPYAERMQLFNENPEAYNTAMNSK